MTKIHINKGDISQYNGEAIVVSHHKNQRDKDCDLGSAKIVMGGNAFKKHVIKTIVPRWHGGDDREIELLARSQIACLDRAAEAGIKNVAFSAISRDYDEFPYYQAADIAISATALWIDHFGKNSSLEDVHFICDTDKLQRSLEVALDKAGLSS